MVSKNQSRFRRTMRKAGLFLVTALVFFLYCLSLGLDLWNDDKFGGTPADQPIEKGFQSLEEAKNVSPVTYSPSDFIRTFNLKVAQEMGNYGEGETIAFLEADSKFDKEAYLDFCTTFSQDYPELSTTTFPIVFVDGQPLSDATSSGTDIETMLDVEWAHVIAPKAKLLIIDTSKNNFEQIRSIIDRYHVTSVVSTIGNPYTRFTVRLPWLDWLSPVFQRTQTLKWLSSHTAFFASSGDAGSNINPAIVAPESVVVGGVEEDKYKKPHDLSSFEIWSGEGYGSGVFYTFAPPWQKTANSHHYFWRQIPDVVWLAGYPGVFIKTNQGWDIRNGTSLSAPCWAALWSLGDAAHKLTTGTPLPPNPNQVLYSIAQTNPTAFIKATTTDRWTEQWGLGFPDCTNLVKTLSTFNGNDLLTHRDFPIATIPFWIMVCCLIGVLVSGSLLNLFKTVIAKFYPRIENILQILLYLLIALLLPLGAAAVTTIIVMQIPTNMVNGAFHDESQPLFISLLTSRLFAFLVMGTTFSYLLFSFTKKKIEGVGQEPEPLRSGENGKKKHSQLG